jgi:hypothetical protein
MSSWDNISRVSRRCRRSESHPNFDGCIMSESWFRWTEAMRPLQDQCYPTPIPKLDEMLRKDMGLRCVSL